MRAPLRWLPALCIALFAAPAGAQPGPSEPASSASAAGERASAAALFDEGVRLFRDAEFARAARAFLAADRAVPSADALKNALVAARRAGDFKLLADAATRASLRGGEDAADAEVARLGREALVDAAAHLARLEVRCSRPGCAVTLDGAPVEGASVFALPGTHGLAATAPGFVRVERAVACDAGVAYRFDLEPSSTPPPPVAPAPLPPPPGSLRVAPAAFYVGVGVTLLLTGFTIGSGVDALHAKDHLPVPPTTPERDDVLGRARRTDVLLGGAILAGALTAAMGVWLVRWHDGAAATSPRRAATGLPPPGGTASALGSF